MKKLMVYFDEDMHEDLRELAHRQRTTMAALVRYALDKTFEDDLDQIAAERALEEAAGHPEDVMTLEEYAKERGLALPSRSNPTSQTRPKKVAERRGQYRSRPAGKPSR
jgi:hypothetical protein